MKRRFALLIAVLLLFARALAEDLPVPGSAAPSAAPETYDAVYVLSGNEKLARDVVSNGWDESTVWVNGGSPWLRNMTVTRRWADASGEKADNLYGVGAAVLVTEGEAEISDCNILSDAAGGTGILACGPGVVRVYRTKINTEGDASGGIQVDGGGTLYATDVNVRTSGCSSAAVCAIGGSLFVDGGKYVAAGSGSPAVYVTADAEIRGAELRAEASEALRLEGLNAVRLSDCSLTGNMPDQPEDGESWNVIVCRSMPDNLQTGEALFRMTGGTLAAENGGMFYTTNTRSRFYLQGVRLIPSDEDACLLRVTGNRLWGEPGQNGAQCTFIATSQDLMGTIIWDSISALDMRLTGGSCYTGTFRQDESVAGDGGDEGVTLRVEEGSTWIVTEDCFVDTIENEGVIMGLDGRVATVVDTLGVEYVRGGSACTVTTNSYHDKVAKNLDE